MLENALNSLVQVGSVHLFPTICQCYDSHDRVSLSFALAFASAFPLLSFPFLSSPFSSRTPNGPSMAFVPPSAWEQKLFPLFPPPSFFCLHFHGRSASIHIPYSSIKLRHHPLPLIHQPLLNLFRLYLLSMFPSSISSSGEMFLYF